MRHSGSTERIRGRHTHARLRNRTIVVSLAGIALLAGGGGAAASGGEIVEEFADTAFLDARSTAIWALGGSGRLVAGTGLGGNGSDGIFVAAAPETILDTDGNGGLFNFSRFSVPAGTRVVFRGRNAARVRVLRRAEIHGAIDLRGGDGQTASVRRQVTEGGVAGPGGGRGGRGNPNGVFAVSLAGEAGESVPRVMGRFGCNTGTGLREGGGCAGRRATSGAGSGGGGGHRDVGATDNGVSPNSGLGGLVYGDSAISDLRGGSGGGGGGNDDDGGTFDQDDPGGAGGGGGGALALEVGGLLAYSGAVDATGGRGGSGFQQSGAGGGGSGGAILVRAGRILPMTSGRWDATGGFGGSLSAPGRPGGGGSPGRIRFEDADGVVSIDRTTVLVQPAESAGRVGDSIRLGRTAGMSLYYDTGVADPRYEFDGSDPVTGALRTDAGVTDLVLPNGVPPGTRARIVFAGALSDPNDPDVPDPSTALGPVRDVRLLNGYRFIRFAVQFDLGSALPVTVVPEVERLRIRFVCP